MEIAYRVQFTEEAAQQRDALAPERRERFDRGLEVLARDPFHGASKASGQSEADRKVQVVPGVLADYLVGRLLVVVVGMTVFGESDYLMVEDA